MKITHWPPSSGDNPFHLMGRLKGRMFQVVQSRFEKAGLDLGLEGFVILTHIRQHDGLHQTQLAEIIGRDRPSVTRALDVLEKGGWLRRSVDPEDRRSHRLAITKEGREALKRAAPLLHDIISQIFAPVSDADFQVFLSVLRTLGHQLDSLDT